MQIWVGGPNLAETYETERWRGRIEALLEANTESTKRLETKLLGEDGNPESGMVASIIARVSKLEVDRVRLGVVLVIGMGLFHLLGEHIFENLFKKIIK